MSDTNQNIATDSERGSVISTDDKKQTMDQSTKIGDTQDI